MPDRPGLASVPELLSKLHLEPHLTLWSLSELHPKPRLQLVFVWPVMHACSGPGRPSQEAAAAGCSAACASFHETALQACIRTSSAKRPQGAATGRGCPTLRIMSEDTDAGVWMTQNPVQGSLSAELLCALSRPARAGLQWGRTELEPCW